MFWKNIIKGDIKIKTKYYYNMIIRKLDIGNFSIGNDYAPTHHFLDPITTSALITSGVNLVGGLIGSHQNNKNQEALMQKQIEAQKQLQKNQNQWNLDMWNKQTEYNTPYNQRSLYEDAGLNPSYFLGQGNGTAGSVQSSTMSAPSAPTPAGDYGFLGSLGTSILQQELLKSEISKNYSDAGLSNTQSNVMLEMKEYDIKLKESIRNMNESKKKEYDQNVENLKAQKEYTESLKGLTDVQKKQADLAVQFYPIMQTAQLYEVIARIDNYLANTELTKAQKAFLETQKSLIYSQIRVNNSQVGLNNANARLSNEKAKTEKHVRDKLDSETNVNNAQEAKIYTEQEGQEIQNNVDRLSAPAKVAGEYVGVVSDATNILFNISDKLGMTNTVSTFLGGSGDSSTSNPSQDNNNNYNNNRRGNYKGKSKGGYRRRR